MFSGLESPTHWLVILVIAALVFGPKRLPELGRSLGAGLRGFKSSLEGEPDSKKLPPVEPTEAPEKPVDV